MLVVKNIDTIVRLLLHLSSSCRRILKLLCDRFILMLIPFGMIISSALFALCKTLSKLIPLLIRKNFTAVDWILFLLPASGTSLLPLNLLSQVYSADLLILFCLQNSTL